MGNNMQFAIIENNTVTNVAVAEAPLADNWITSKVAAIGDLYENGQFIKPQPPTKSPEEIKTEIVTSTQQRLDDFSVTRNYDSILSACTYATSTVPKFAAEGQYCVEARDATWSKVLSMLAEVDAGTRPIPSGYADIEPELPALVWPA